MRRVPGKTARAFAWKLGRKCGVARLREYCVSRRREFAQPMTCLEYIRVQKVRPRLRDTDSLSRNLCNLQSTSAKSDSQNGTECDQRPCSVHLMTGSPMRTKPSLHAYCTVSPTSSLAASCSSSSSDDWLGWRWWRGRRRRPCRGGSGGGQWIAVTVN